MVPGKERAPALQAKTDETFEHFRAIPTTIYVVANKHQVLDDAISRLE